MTHDMFSDPGTYVRAKVRRPEDVAVFEAHAEETKRIMNEAFPPRTFEPVDYDRAVLGVDLPRGYPMVPTPVHVVTFERGDPTTVFRGVYREHPTSDVPSSLFDTKRVAVIERPHSAVHPSFFQGRPTLAHPVHIVFKHPFVVKAGTRFESCGMTPKDVAVRLGGTKRAVLPKDVRLWIRPEFAARAVERGPDPCIPEDEDAFVIHYEQ